MEMTVDHTSEPQDMTRNVTRHDVDAFQSCVNRLYQAIVPTVFSLVIVSGLVGNFIVIYLILSQQKLRTVTNLLLLNLAIADVSFLLICGTFSVVHYVLMVWPFGDTFCRITQFLNYATCYVTVYTLIAVSVVRYVIVVHGPHARVVRSKRSIVIIIVSIWVVFLLAKIPILVVHGVSYDPATNRTQCIISGRKEAQQLFASFFVFAYALPLTVIATLYVMIVCHLRKNRQRRQAAPPGSSPAAPGEERNRHVTKVVIIVVAVFAICWLPLHIHLLVAYYGKLPESIAYKVLLLVWHCLGYANSLANPIIYHFCSRDFRESCSQVFGRKPVPVDV